jgi:hypothetical protein
MGPRAQGEAATVGSLGLPSSKLFIWNVLESMGLVPGGLTTLPSLRSKVITQDVANSLLLYVQFPTKGGKDARNFTLYCPYRQF